MSARVLVFLLLSASWINARADDGMAAFRQMKYGFFVHYTWGGSYGGTHNRDGSMPAGVDDLANRFDAPGFANDLASMGVEYVIFTAWHADMNCLWPSVKMNQWLTGHTSQRDLLGEMIAAVKAKGIHVLLYTHPRAGHGMSAQDQSATGWNGTIGSNPDFAVFDRAKWNNFINDIYSDLIDRYGKLIDGLFMDEGVVEADSWRVVDYPRLRQTVKSRQPDLIMIQNFYGTNYSCDIGAKEVAYWQAWTPESNPNNWPATGQPMSMQMGGDWYATVPEGVLATRYDAARIFRHTVLRAGINSEDGGGVNWAAGPYPGGGWETGVLAQMQQIGSWLAPIRPSICQTYPSQSWITVPDATINSLSGGFVATHSLERGTEFIHVLRPPNGNSITIPAPADGHHYAKASLLVSGQTVDLTEHEDGSLTLTLPSSTNWDSLDTVIELHPADLTWVADAQAGGSGGAVWDGVGEEFLDQEGSAAHFRTRDNVSFAAEGAAQVFYAVPGGFVGKLSFSGKDYDIYPGGGGSLNLGGAIDVAGGKTVTFHQSFMGTLLNVEGQSGLTKTGEGTLTLSLATNYTGTTTVQGGIAAFWDLGGVGNIVFEGGILRHLLATSDISSRIRHSSAAVQVDTGGNDLTYATPLSNTNSAGLVKRGSGRLSLAGGTHAPGNPIVVVEGELALGEGNNAVVSIQNPGFEEPAYAPGEWEYQPAGTGWTFNEDSGTASNGSPWVGVAAEGVQCAFLQNNGLMSQGVNVTIPGDYLLSFVASNRPGFHPTGLIVYIDDVQVLRLRPGEIGSGQDFTRFRSGAVRLAAGQHTLTLAGIADGEDTDTLIDDITLVGVTNGSIAPQTSLSLAGPTSTFHAGASTLMLSSLTGISGSQMVLSGSTLIVSGDNPDTAFGGRITGIGNLVNQGTLRLVGSALLDFNGTFTNHGVVDLINWNGNALPANLVNYGTVLDRNAVRVVSVVKLSQALSLAVQGYSGHSYQLQRCHSLPGGWENLGDAIRGTGEVITFSAPFEALAAQNYYRVLVSY